MVQIAALGRWILWPYTSLRFLPLLKLCPIHAAPPNLKATLKMCVSVNVENDNAELK